MSCWINRSISSWSGRPKSNRCWGKLCLALWREEPARELRDGCEERLKAVALHFSCLFYRLRQLLFPWGRQTDLGAVHLVGAVVDMSLQGRAWAALALLVRLSASFPSCHSSSQPWISLSPLFWWAWHTGLYLNFEIFFSQPGLNFLVVLRNCILCTLYLRLKNKKGWVWGFFLRKIICWALSRFQIQFLVKDSRYNYCDRDQSLSELWKCWGPTL